MNRDCKSFEQEKFAPIGVAGRIVPDDTAFSWGYVDVIDADGNGVVLIWGYANPFVPGTLSRCRAGLPPAPSEDPSICVSVYERGKPSFYLVQKLPSVPSADPFRASGVDLQGVRVRFDDGLQVTLDVPVPGGSRLTGSLRMSGVAPELAADAPQSRHRWGPRLLGPAQVELQSGTWSFSMEGRGYHDGNVSSASLHELSIEGWVWGRVPFPNGDWIYYLVQGEHEDLQVHLSLFVHPDGTVERLPGHVLLDGPPSRAFWGMRHARSFTVDGFEVRVEDVVDDGPFYLRMNTCVTSPDGTTAVGVGEVVHVPSMDAGWTAPLAPMAVYDSRLPSWFSPLFSGPHRGRLVRLIRHWLGF